MQNRELIKAVYYFCKKLRLRCLTGFWTRHYISSVSKRKLTRTFCCDGWYNMETVSFCHNQRQLESITSAFIFVFPFHCVVFSNNACICTRSNQKVFIHTSYKLTHSMEHRVVKSFHIRVVWDDHTAFLFQNKV